MRVDCNAPVCEALELPQAVLRLLRSIKTMELSIRHLTASRVYNLGLEKKVPISAEESYAYSNQSEQATIRHRVQYKIHRLALFFGKARQGFLYGTQPRSLTRKKLLLEVLSSLV